MGTEPGRRERVTASLRRSWAGAMCLDEINLAELRAILAAHLGPKPGRRKRARLAAELGGITEYRVRRFLEGGDLREREFESVAKWSEDKGDPRVSPYVVAVGMLTRWFNAKDTGAARRELWAFVCSMYERRGVKMPLLAREDVSTLLDGVEDDPD